MSLGDGGDARTRTPDREELPSPGKSGWIVIPNWFGDDGFQHYKDRDPIWIKNYRRLLNNPDYLELSLHARGVLHGLWLTYAASDGQIPDSTSVISRQLGERVTRPTLDSLNHAGFIEVSASRPLALRYQRASPEKRREEKKKKPLPAEPVTEIQRKRDYLWESLVTAVGRSPETAVERKKWNAALRELREAGAKPEDIKARAAAYQKEWPTVDLTPWGLASNWSRFGTAQVSPRMAALERIRQRDVA